MDDSRLRSIIKTVSWRVLATIITIVIVFLFTGEIALALSIGGIEVIIKLIFYYFHERIWNSVFWGKNKDN